MVGNITSCGGDEEAGYEEAAPVKERGDGERLEWNLGMKCIVDIADRTVYMFTK